MRRYRLGVLLAVAVGLAPTGCGREAHPVSSAPEVSASPSTAPPAAPSAASATTDAAGPVDPFWPMDCPPMAASGALPPAGEVTAALRCVGAPERIPGDGEWRVISQQRVTGAPVNALVAALALPSKPPTDGACAAVAIAPIHVELETARGPVTVASPKDDCGQPRPEVRAAFEALTWVTVSSTKLQQLRPEAAVTADCPAWKDEFANLGSSGKPAAGPKVDRQAHDVRVCRYTTTTGPDPAPVGGRTLPPAEVGRLAALVAAAPAAGTCGQPHTRFAVVRFGTTWLSVELDGCRRILSDPYRISQASDELVTLLATT